MTSFKTLAGAGATALLAGLIAAGANKALADQVFNDDVIVIGSLCVGLDCRDNEPFGGDVVMLKENNLVVFFNDTSTIPGFPANKWRITINDFFMGGASFFAIDDSTAGRQPFRIMAGAPSNSLFVAPTGNIGLRTSTPALDLHINSGNTPSIRLEQNASAQFPAQTWDILANEANFIVRDMSSVTLPFRIRPGAPTSSLDINSGGNVAIGTAFAPVRLTVSGGFTGPAIDVNEIAQFAKPNAAYVTVRDNVGHVGIWGTNQGPISVGSLSNHSFSLLSSNAIRMTIDPMGQVGIGTTIPTSQFHTTGGVRFAAITGCAAGLVTDAFGNVSCLISSRQFKTITGDLNPATALTNIMALRPQVGAYTATPDVPEHWLIAEDVASIDPALAGFKDDKPYTVKTQNVVADLVAVIQQQQRQIEQQQQQIEQQRQRIGAIEKTLAR